MYLPIRDASSSGARLLQKHLVFYGVVGFAVFVGFAGLAVLGHLMDLVDTCPSRLKEEPLVLFLFVQEQQLGGLDEQHQPDEPLQVGWYLDR